MRVNLLAVPEAARIADRVGGLLLPLPGDISAAEFQREEEQRTERIRRSDEKAAAAIAALGATRPADVVQEAERNLDRSSRAFRRQTVRDAATDRFQEQRQAFRQALSEAEGRRTPVAARTPAEAAPPGGEKTQGETRSATSETAHVRRSPTGPNNAAEQTKAPPAVRPAGNQITAESGPAGRATQSAGAALRPGGGQAPAATAIPSQPMIGQFARGNGSAAASRSPAQVEAAQSGSSNGGAKGGGNVPAVAGATRAASRSATPAGAKGRATQRAENAEWRANLERIVRVVRSRVSAQRAQTTLRLEPPELGRLRLHLDLRGEALALRVDTTTALAHRLLLEDADKLRQGLEVAGVHLERLEIRPPLPNAEVSEQGWSQENDTQPQTEGESSHADAERPGQHGTDSQPTESGEVATGGARPGPVAESLVNVVA
jgi:flagellar hook-length control protein FliK